MVIGLENELPISIGSPHTPAKRKQLASSIVNCVMEVTTAVPVQEGRVSQHGYMLSNGSKIYEDVGAYVENATPEVRTPLEAVVYQRANELLLLKALQKATLRMHIKPVDIKLVRAVTDYANHYCGMHINVSARRFEAAGLIEHLTPFIVTRFYACAGGIGAAGFTMSQKNSAIKTIASEDTRQNRGIINLRREPLANASFKRIHITHNDATMSELSTFLTTGCTALVVKMLDDGVCVGPCYKLADPVGALKQIDNDFYWSKPLDLASGLRASPLDIQEHYLRVAEVYSAGHDNVWMKEVVKRWRWALETLRTRGPKGLCRELDPYIKLQLYSTSLRKHGTTLTEFSHWARPIEMAKSYFDGGHQRDIRNYLKEQMPAVNFYFLEEHIGRKRLNWCDLQKARRLYDKMISLDIMFHDIGEQGLYFCLRNASIVNSELVNKARLHEAMLNPPRDTRAYARGSAIREAAGESGTVASWVDVRNRSRHVYLPDPLVNTYIWQQLERSRPGK